MKFVLASRRQRVQFNLGLSREESPKVSEHFTTGGGGGGGEETVTKFFKQE